MNTISKNVERRCLDIVKKIKKYDFLQEKIVESERPDFVVGEIGIEHFLVDILVNDFSASISRKQDAEKIKKIEEYNKHPEKLDECIETGEITKYLEKNIKEQIDGLCNFNYNEFINNFKRVFDKHCKNIEAYRKKCKILGFLIEIPYPKPMNTGYVIMDNDTKRTQRLKIIPITKDMIKCFQYANNIDFIVLCIIPINFKEDYSECQVVKVDMKNIEKSIRQQGMIICDKFDYSQGNICKPVPKITIESTNYKKQ